MYDFDIWYLVYTFKFSFSTCINNTGMPGDGGQNTFDISICRNFGISIYRNFDIRTTGATGHVRCKSIYWCTRIYKVHCRNVGNVKSRGWRESERDTQATPSQLTLEKTRSRGCCTRRILPVGAAAVPLLCCCCCPSKAWSWAKTGRAKMDGNVNTVQVLLYTE